MVLCPGDRFHVNECRQGRGTIDTCRVLDEELELFAKIRVVETIVKKTYFSLCMVSRNFVHVFRYQLKD